MPVWIIQSIGIGLGCILTIAVVSILFSKKTIAASLVAVLMVAFAFFIASGFDWSSIKITKEGVEVLRADVGDTAEAVRVLAEQMQQSDDAVKVIAAQLTALTQQLSSTNAVAPAATHSIQQALRLAPAIDRTQLNATKAKMLSIERRLKKVPGQ